MYNGVDISWRHTYNCTCAHCSGEDQMLVTTTGTFRTYTKAECIREIVHYSQKIMDAKWYESKRYWKSELRFYLKKYNELCAK
jgi:hypothetical protein